MQIDRLIYPVKSLGPGNRIVIWTIGCCRHCPQCANPELWMPDPRREVSIELLTSVIENTFKENEVDGITFTGGEPFQQPAELLKLVRNCSKFCKDILIFTGYTVAELKNGLVLEAPEILSEVAVLIDGAYIERLNDNASVLRGSTNQRIHYLKRDFELLYSAYLKQGRKIHNVLYQDKLISIGIHNREGKEQRCVEDQ